MVREHVCCAWASSIITPPLASDDGSSLSSSPASPMVTNRVDVFWHEGMLRHDAVEGVFDTGYDPGFLDVLEKHPENADRVRNMLSILRRGPIAPHVNWFTGLPAIVSELLMFHTSGTSL